MEKEKQFRVGRGSQYSLDSRQLCVNKSRGIRMYFVFDPVCVKILYNLQKKNESKAVTGLELKGVGRMQV